MINVISWGDLWITPFYLILIFAIIKNLEKKIIDAEMRKYFIPAFWAKVVGAVMVGLIYKFYYGWGDSFFYYQDSVLMYDAFYTNPEAGLQLIFGETIATPENAKWYNRLAFEKDPASFMVSRIASFFALFCFNTYMVMAILFACYSMWGGWQLYRVFCDNYPHMKKQLAIAVFFMPSLFFWGSGLLKDSITYGSLGLVVYGYYYFLLKGKRHIKYIIAFLIGIFFLKSIKIYILLCIIPALAYWSYLQYGSKIKNDILRYVAGPILLTVFGLVGFRIIQVAAAGTDYDFNHMAKEIKITSDYIRSVSKEGSSYYLGEYDGTFENLLSHAPEAIFVTLYRPFIWESLNPFMLMAASENFYLLFLTLSVFLRTSPLKVLKSIRKDHLVPVGLIFSLSFSFFVGVASGNFGTLVRYKIPMMPFYVALTFIIYQGNKPVSFRNKNSNQKNQNYNYKGMRRDQMLLQKAMQQNTKHNPK